MNKIRIVADKHIPFLQGLLDDIADVTLLDAKEITNETLLFADALITRTRCKCDANLLENTTIKYIATATIGFDHIDTEYCQTHGINWSNAPGCNANSVANYINAALQFADQNPQGKTIGIIGVGNVGSRVAKVAENLGYKVLLNDPPRSISEPDFKGTCLEKIQEKADIITIHTPYNKETHHLINKDFLNNCKHKPLIINAARGPIADNKDLLEYDGQIILDCWENEPNIDIELLNKVLIATPHIAGYSIDGKANGTKAAARAICKFFNIEKEIEIKLPAKENKPYDIVAESIQLKNNPSGFEWMRNNYPIRRDIIEY